MTVKMSSEGDAPKNVAPEANEKSGTDNTDSSQDSQDVEDLKSTKPAENNTEADDTDSKEKEEPKDEPKEEDEQPESAEAKKEDDEKPENDVDKKEKKEAEENDAHEEETENSEKTEEEDEDASDKESKDPKEKGKKDVPLLDQPLEKSGKRERKNVQRFNEPPVEKETKFEIPNGSGTPLGEIPRIEASIARFKNDDLKMLHKVLFKVVGKTTMIKKNIKKFCGFDFKKDSDDYSKKLASLQKYEAKHLRSICEMLDLPKTGNKEDITERIMGFLMEPADSGKPVSGGRPKRSAAVKANNRGYSSHDDYSSDEKPSRAKRGKGKRSSLKDATSSESDEEFQPSDDDEKPRVAKRKRTSGRKKAKSEDEQSDEAQSGGSESESDQEEPKGKQRKKPTKANNKAKEKATPNKRGRKPAAAATPKKTPKSAKKKAKESSEEEHSDHKDDGSSSEDEPLAKKAKGTNPPTDDEIKTYIKEILEGANLEEITMKNVCQQVYAHYPDFDLAHKKEFIKSTVKSLIST